MSAILGQLGRLGTLGGASTGGLTKAALIARLTTLGAVACFLPSDYAVAAFESARIYPGPARAGYGVGLMYDALGGYTATEVLINREFDNNGAGWTKIGTVTFSGSSATCSGTGSGIKQGALLPYRAYLSKMTVTQQVESGTYMLKFSSSSNASSFGGTEYLMSNGLGDFSTHLLTDAASVYGGFFGISGIVPTGVLILTAPSLRLVGGYICRQLTESNRPTLRYSGGIYYLDPTSGQGLTAYLPASVGSTCTVIYANPGGGAVVATGVTVSSQAAWLPYKHSGLVIMPSTASAEAVATVAAMVDVLSRRVVV